MKARTTWSLLRSGRLGVLRSVSALATNFYHVSFVAAAARSGLLGMLGAGPRSPADIAAALAIGKGDEQALSAWLDVGVAAGVLRRRGDAYGLSRRALALASAENDDVLALLEEIVDLHARLVLETPDRLRAGRRFARAEHDAEVAARASRVLEAFIREAVEEFVPPRGTLRLLEIGCGSGTHIRSAAARNPELTAVGLELSSAVAEMARRNLEGWGLSDRVSIEVGDVRNYSAEARFDLATMHQNVYYFPEAEHVRVFAKMRDLLAPGGRLLVTTGCRGGSPAIAVLSLWGAMTEGASPLPEPAHVTRALAEAGFGEIAARNLLAPSTSSTLSPLGRSRVRLIARAPRRAPESGAPARSRRTPRRSAARHSKGLLRLEMKVSCCRGLHALFPGPDRSGLWTCVRTPSR